MSSQRATLETSLYASAILAAFLFRFINLGLLPLTDLEAGWALQAAHVADGLKPTVGSNPAYVHLTAVLFFVFGPTNFAARFWSALAGTILVLLPMLWRERLGTIPALLLTFFLACDPGMLALSRQAGSAMMAMTAIILTWTLWIKGKRGLAAAIAAVAILSGSGTWYGLTGLVLAWGIRKAICRQEAVKVTSIITDHRALRISLGMGAIVLVALESLLLFSPKGMTGIFSAAAVFVSGWWSPSGVGISRLLIALPAYALMPLVFGLTGLYHGIRQREPTKISLGSWTMAAFLLAQLYPARQVSDLAWMMLPLWTLAALELGRHADLGRVQKWEIGGVILLMMAILSFSWLNLAGVAGVTMKSNYGQMKLLLTAGGFLLVILILILVAVGWSKDIARIGGLWGLAIMLAVFTLGMATGAGGLRQPHTKELWTPAATIADADLLIKTTENISEWSQGSIESLPVVVMGVDSPALTWLFRDWEFSETMTISPTDSPALVITPASSELNLAAAYRGEEFIWRQNPTWDLANFTDWMSWFVHRDMPTTNENIVLWVRTDLLIDSQDQPVNP